MQVRKQRPGTPARTLDATALTPTRVLALAVAGISPTASLFVVFGTGLSLSGTGFIWAFLLGSVIAVAMALCFAEVGSVYPAAGGAFTIIERALGSFFGGIASVLFLVLGVIFVAVGADSLALFIGTLVPGGVPIGLTGFGLLVLVALLTVGRVAPASWVAAGMLVLELAVILTFTGFAFAHPALHANPFTHPELFAGNHIVLAFGSGALFAGAAPALLALNGYDAPLYLVEETERKRTAPIGVLVSVGISIVIELTAVIAATFALPPNPASAAASGSPLSVIATSVMGSTGAKLLTIGVIIAIFDAALVGYLVLSRVLFDAARRDMWPGRAANRLLAYVGPTRAPAGACLVLFAGAAVFTLWSTLTTLVTFTSVVLVLIYLLVAVAAIVTRLRTRAAPAAFRMPLWPAAPLVAIAGVALVLRYQTGRDLLITGIIVGCAAAYHAGRQVWRRARPAPAAPAGVPVSEQTIASPSD